MTSPRGENPRDPRGREAYTGGADAVNDTPGVPSRGTEPGGDDRRRSKREPVKTSVPAIGWVAILVAILVAAALIFGIFQVM